MENMFTLDQSQLEQNLISYLSKQVFFFFIRQRDDFLRKVLVLQLVFWSNSFSLSSKTENFSVNRNKMHTAPELTHLGLESPAELNRPFYWLITKV